MPAGADAKGLRHEPRRHDGGHLVWEETVLVWTGETVDLLLEITNPGIWMAHCHIAEHHESGMMFSFRVDPRVEGT
ncbi:MAG TPA: multicopper oxidase domain-containing protein [Miltoncostaeaceae bacterium]|nr:multicopper oxidase domain-containing protein [Miltoncostaeaceae bacterium]